MNIDLINKFSNKIFTFKNSFCAHYILSGIAYSRIDCTILNICGPWDYAQYLLVEEAGEIVTDFQGNEFDLTKKNIVASNKTIHKELIKIINQK